MAENSDGTVSPQEFMKFFENELFDDQMKEQAPDPKEVLECRITD
jgi:hypothetical protein